MKSKLTSGASIFHIMTELSNKHDAINLSQGFPGFNPDSRLLNLVCDFIKGENNQYAPMSGIPELRNNIANKINKYSGRNVHPDKEVTVSDGATEALFSVIMGVVHPGDEVVVFDPAYDNYVPAVLLAGGTTKHVPLIRTDNRPDYHIDFQMLKESISKKTKLIILNFPHNPTGSILKKSDLEALEEIVSHNNVYLMSDEVYEHIVFDGMKHLSLASNDALWERSFVISSFGKTFHATGWKVGYCAAPEELTNEMRQIHQWSCYSVVTPIQLGIAKFLETYPEYIDTLSDFYESKRNLFCGLIKNSNFSFQPSAGSFYQLLDYSEISSENDTSFAEKLTKEIGVASIPISVFYNEPPKEHKLRFCFAKDDAVIEKAAGKLCQL
jgi:methionine aminotransferase